MPVTPRVRFLVGAFIVLAGGCSGNTASLTVPPASQPQPAGVAAQAGTRATTIVPAWTKLSPQRAQGPGWISPAAHGQALLYVANYNAGVVEIYMAQGKNQSPVGQITSGLAGPEGMAVAKGFLYVTNTSNNTVTVYHVGKTTPSKTYSQGLNAPAGVVVGTDGTVYVSNLFGNNVVAYAHGSKSPTSTYSGLNFPIAVTLDAKNNLYVTFSGGIEEFPSGSTSGTNLGISLQNASGIAIDTQDNIVVANQMPPAVYVYPQGATQPSMTFGQEGDPNPIAFLKSRKQLFVGEPLSNTVNVYAYPSGKKINSVTNGVNFPAGVAVSPKAPF
jgi:sugar lactone lactonase YvrE